MSNRGIQTKIMKILGHTTWLVMQVCMLVLVFMISWFLYTIVRDGISAQMMTFESEPSQGWEYWHSKYRNEALRGWAVPILVAAIIIGTLVYGAIRTAIKIYHSWQSDEDESAGPGSLDILPDGEIRRHPAPPIIQETEQGIAPNDR